MELASRVASSAATEVAEQRQLGLARQALHGACAQALFELNSARHAGVARRRALHLECAGKGEQALDPHYSRAAELWGAEEQRNALVARYNLALVEVGAGEFAVARSLFTELVGQYAAAGFEARLALVYAGLMTGAVAEGDWRDFEKRCEQTSNSIFDTGIAHADLVWMTRRALQLIEARQHPEVHRVVLDFACEQLERLERSAEAKALRDEQLAGA